MSYGALAAKLECPKAMRAVGHANGSNPISVVVPCHRLIGAGGSLVKYGGGLERKRWLLAHEGVVLEGGVAYVTAMQRIDVQLDVSCTSP